MKRHGNVRPMTCAVCSRVIPAGSGRVVFADDGAETFVHDGPCAAKVGATDGGTATWTSIAEWAAAKIEGRRPVKSCPGAGGGFALVDVLVVVAQVGAVVAVVMVAARLLAKGAF